MVIPQGILEEVVAKAKSERPGLVLADINLGEGGSGIDAVNEILSSFDIPVIFITAYPEKLLTGERPEPTYLIAKPFLPETVQATVGQALFFHPVAREAALLFFFSSLEISVMAAKKKQNGNAVAASAGDHGAAAASKASPAKSP